ncbi:hypothetical protein J2T60_001227 [Natronospira proteinivora]|uniref:Uncharacterized protein n=1 Tax=Natronospira proteinivora TaxID=1807133 RepID=A0ABT1G7I9_9GAMM|nr:hypothetical protein [Natronospira proteinivora]MCP1727262.1 hypothetical protein [Natronospira proteinivora]
MTTREDHLIPEPLRSDESFLKDLQRFKEAPVELLWELRGNDIAQPRKPSGTRLEELASKYQMDDAEVFSIYMIANLILSRLTKEEHDPSEVVSEIGALLEEDIEDHDELRKFFCLSEEEKQDALDVRALDFGAAYLSSDLRPMFVPVSENDNRMVAGFLMSLEYITSEREKSSVTFALTRKELKQLKDKIARAETQLLHLGSPSK